MKKLFTHLFYFKFSPSEFVSIFRQFRVQDTHFLMDKDEKNLFQACKIGDLARIK